MSIARRHHFVPQFYLAQWANDADSRLFEFKRRYKGVTPRPTFPAGTGYKFDLYRVDGLPEPLASSVETKFMGLVDGRADAALQRILSGDRSPWTQELRSAWTRFILSLLFRNPSTVAMIKQQMKDIWIAATDDLKENYASRRIPDDPDTFEEFIAKTDPASPHKVAFIFLQDVIDNQLLGPAIFEMIWSTVDVSNSHIPLLTSDRPLDMPFGLGDPLAHIAMPVSKNKLFVAYNESSLLKNIHTFAPSDIVKRMNKITVAQAREFVWA